MHKTKIISYRISDKDAEDISTYLRGKGFHVSKDHRSYEKYYYKVLDGNYSKHDNQILGSIEPTSWHGDYLLVVFPDFDSLERVIDEFFGIKAV